MRLLLLVFAMCLMLVPLNVTGQNLNDGLIAYYPFNGNADDESGSGYHGTVAGATLTEDRLGNTSSAYLFDGTAYIETPLELILDATDDFTVSFWIRCDPGCIGREVMGFERRLGQEIIFRMTTANSVGGSGNGEVSFVLRDDNRNTSRGFSSTLIADGSWHLVTGIRDTSQDELRIYVDGIFDSSINDITQGTTNASQTREFTIGANNHSHKDFFNPFIGALDEVRIYNRALTDEEIEVLVNQMPIANAGPDQSVECVSEVGASITLDGTGSSDPDEDVLSYTWTGSFGTAAGPMPTITLPPGSHAVTLTVEDGNGGVDTDEVSVVIQDTTPPEITVNAGPIELWPPNHKYYTFYLDDLVADVVDACDATVSPDAVVMASVSSDEPENGQGDGNTANDIMLGETCQSVDVRAERQGGGNGRVYTIHLAVSDESGNEGLASYQIHVPKSKKGDAEDDGPTYVVNGCSTSTIASGSYSSVSPDMAQAFVNPTDYSLANYPNPFNPVTTIAYSLPQPSRVTLAVYDMLGRKVETLIKGDQSAGQHRTIFDASNLPSGVYMYRLQAGEYTETKVMTLMR